MFPWSTFSPPKGSTLYIYTLQWQTQLRMTLKVKKGEISFLSFLRLIVHYVQHLLDAPNVPGAGKSRCHSRASIPSWLSSCYCNLLTPRFSPEKKPPRENSCTTVSWLQLRAQKFGTIHFFSSSALLTKLSLSFLRFVLIVYIQHSVINLTRCYLPRQDTTISLIRKEWELIQ